MLKIEIMDATETKDAEVKKKTAKDYASDQEVKWCPGCGDYAILAAFQQAMTKIDKKKEDIVCVSGIGCSSRFPYYVDTYGYHTIHGRAPAIASGLKLANPDLSVWVITGDGDGLSIGGNHLIHALRRDLDLNIILFNNEIYGLTKGQFSPTTKLGKVTKTSPAGVIDRAFNPIMMALASGASYVARTTDKDVKEMTQVMIESAENKGASFVEILQNCVIFNHGTHDLQTNKETADDHTINLEDGKVISFGKDKSKCLIRHNGLITIATLAETDESLRLVHNIRNKGFAFELIVAEQQGLIPKVKGVIYKENKEELKVTKKLSEPTPMYIENYIFSNGTWKVE